MAKKLAFILELENGAKLVSDISDVELRYKGLSKEIRATEKAIDTLTNGSKEQKSALEKEGLTIEKLETKYKVLKAEQIDLSKTKKNINGDIRDQIKLFDSLGNKVPTNSLIGLRRTYRDLRKEIDSMDTAARQSVEGLAKIEKAKGIKNQINEIGKSVGDFREQVGSYEEAVTRVFDKFGIGKGGGAISNIVDPIVGLLSGGGGGILAGLGGLGDPNPASGDAKDPLSGLVKALGPGGILATAGVAVLATTADYVADITLEFEKMNQKVGQLTGIAGRELTGATVQIKTISEVYNEEFDEILRAAQATSKAFNSDIGDTLNLIQQGLAGGANLNNEFLDSMREYPRLIKEAGLSQEQFIEILVRSTKEGIYSDKGIDVIKEGNIRIREQTKATRTALEGAFGKEATDTLLNGVNEGSITTFEAIQTVSKGLDELDLSAEQTGTLLADVFGGAGEDAGVEFIKSLQDVQGNLSSIINLSDAYTLRQNNQYNATLQLNTAQQNLASQFAGSGTSVQTLGTKFKALGTDVLDGLILKARATGEEFSNGSILGGLKQLASFNSAGAVQAPTSAEIALREKDLAALRDIGEDEEQLEVQRLERNKRGANGIAGLREEQAKLNQQIQDASAKGEPYGDLLDEYNKITERLTKSTNVLSKSVKTTKKELEGEVGSLVRLRSELSELKKGLSESSDVSESDATKLREKEAQVAEAEAKINDITLKGKQKLIEDEIKLVTEGNVLSATLSIDNEKILQNTVKAIKIQGDIDVLESRLKLEKEGSKDFEKIQLDLAKKRNELSSSEDSLAFFNKDQIIEEATQLSIDIANQISSSESELQTRVSTIQKTATNERIRYRLDNENLTNSERLKLEREFQENKKAIETNNSDLVANNLLDESNDELNRKITALAREAESIEEFERNKTDIILNADLERLQIEKERRISNGEEILEIEREIAEKQLQINDEKNKGILDAQKKRIEDQTKFEKQLVDVQVQTLQGLGAAFGAFFVQSGEDQKDFAKTALLVVLDSVDAIINLYLAQILAKEIASKSFAGIATAAILGGVVKGALGAAKAAISKNEEGDILMPVHRNGTIVRDISSLRSHTRDDLKRGAIFQGYSHASTGEPFSVGGKIQEAEYGEAIINKKSTQKFKPLLSYINGYNGWGKKFQEGALLGEEQATVVPINGKISGSSGITTEQMILFANIVAASQEESLNPLIESIIDKVIMGMDENQRLNDRFSKVQKTA